MRARLGSVVLLSPPALAVPTPSAAVRPQAQRYTVYDETGTLVALVAEDFGGLGKEVGRQLLRSRRSFTATVFSADGEQLSLAGRGEEAGHGRYGLGAGAFGVRGTGRAGEAGWRIGRR